MDRLLKENEQETQLYFGGSELDLRYLLDEEGLEELLTLGRQGFDILLIEPGQAMRDGIEQMISIHNGRSPREPLMSQYEPGFNTVPKRIVHCLDAMTAMSKGMDRVIARERRARYEAAKKAGTLKKGELAYREYSEVDHWCGRIRDGFINSYLRGAGNAYIRSLPGVLCGRAVGTLFREMFCTSVSGLSEYRRVGSQFELLHPLNHVCLKGGALELLDFPETGGLIMPAGSCNGEDGVVVLDEVQQQRLVELLQEHEVTSGLQVA